MKEGKVLEMHGNFLKIIIFSLCKWNMLPNMIPNDHKTIAHYTLGVH